MSAAYTKLLNLELDYDLKEPEKEGLESSSFITRNLINQAFQTNYRDGMDDKIARQWRVIRKLLDISVENEKNGYVIFSSSDFDTIYEEIYKCQYNPMMARFAPYLYDELDKVKHRSIEDEEKEQESMETLRKSSESSLMEAGIKKQEKLKAAV